MIFFDVLLFFAGCILLGASGHLMVRTLKKLTGYYKLKEFVVSFIIVSVLTSLPELFVGIFSALSHIPKLSVGDIIGANIVDLTLVIGIAALLGKKIKIKSEIERKDIFYTSGIAILPLILTLDHFLSETDAIILLFIFLLNLMILYGERKQFKKEVTDKIKKREVLKDSLIFIVGLLILLVSSEIIVQTATKLVVDLNLAPLLIGLILVSIGTTLPELSFEVNSVLRGHSGMALGDLLGSVVTNSTLVLSVTTLLSNGIEFYSHSFFEGIVTMVLVLGMFTVFSKTGHEITWKEGLVLLGIYIVFIITSLLIR
jgi:cation:H+ antiporter